MLLFLFSLSVVSGTITYDSGFFFGFDNVKVPSFNCTNGLSYSQQVQFSQAFLNPPQIILAREKSDLSGALSSTQTQIQFSISDVTTTYFTLFIQCNKNKVFAVRYRWYAIDDKRIQVLNQFNVTNIQNLTFDKFNPNAMVGFISLLNVGFKGPLSFNITISSITLSSVSIQFTDPKQYLGNILQIGYQIILAAPEQLTILNTIYSNQNWVSSNIKVEQNTFFLTPATGYEYLNTENIRIDTVYLSWDPINYRREAWEKAYTPNTHQQIQLLYSFNQNQLPLFCNHFEAIEKVNNILPTSALKILILETNQEFSSNGQYSIFFDKTLSIVNFEITVNCLGSLNIQSSFYIYTSRTRQIQEKSYLNNCSPQYNFIKYNSRFKQQTITNVQLQIEITSISVIVTQINICNQFEISQQQLVAIKVT